MFLYDTTVKLHMTDAAGVLFFGNYFTLAHDAYEQYMNTIGFNFHTIITDEPFLILIVHADADFLKPIHAGDAVRISMQADNIGRTSFTLGYQLATLDGTVIARLHTIHVVIKKKNQRPVAIPEKLKKALEALL